MDSIEKIIHGIDVSKCSHYNPLGNYNCSGIKKCSQWSNCYFKQLQRKEQALDEIEKNIKAMNNECFYDDICDCNNCDMKNGCSYYRKFKILNIINKVKENN